MRREGGGVVQHVSEGGAVPQVADVGGALVGGEGTDTQCVHVGNPFCSQLSFCHQMRITKWLFFCPQADPWWTSAGLPTHDIWGVSSDRHQLDRRFPPQADPLRLNRVANSPPCCLMAAAQITFGTCVTTTRCPTCVPNTDVAQPKSHCQTRSFLCIDMHVPTKTSSLTSNQLVHTWGTTVSTHPSLATLDYLELTLRLTLQSPPGSCFCPEFPTATEESAKEQRRRPKRRPRPGMCLCARARVCARAT